MLAIHCNTISTEETDKDADCSANTPVTHGAGSEQYYANTWQETYKPERSCTNTKSNSNCCTTQVEIQI